MNRLIAGVVTAGIVLSSAQLFADARTTEQINRDQRDQLIKDCMSRMAAKNDGSSKHAMKKACNAELNNSMNKDSMIKDDNPNPPNN
jgi:pentapeptide MXKDX repeat protein